VKSPDYYKGREQTYLKHYVLEQYLETVAFHIGYAQTEFVYVDCFSGPWRNESDDLADTSIRIALDKLNYVRNVLAPHQKYPTIRAIFIEQDPDSFAALQQALETHRGSVQAIGLPAPSRTTYRQSSKLSVQGSRSASLTRLGGRGLGWIRSHLSYATSPVKS
jgi:hypothetical protein